MSIINWLKIKLGLKTVIEEADEFSKAFSDGVKQGLDEVIPELRERQADERNGLK